MSRVVTFSDGFTSASAPSIVGASQENYTLLNNQATTAITGLVFDSTTTKSVFIDYTIDRVGTVERRQSGSMIAVFNGTWSITFGSYQGDTIIADTLVNTYSATLSIHATTGQISYSSGNQAGHVSSSLKIYLVKVTS